MEPAANANKPMRIKMKGEVKRKKIISLCASRRNLIQSQLGNFVLTLSVVLINNINKNPVKIELPLTSTCPRSLRLQPFRCHPKLLSLIDNENHFSHQTCGQNNWTGANACVIGCNSIGGNGIKQFANIFNLR